MVRADVHVIGEIVGASGFPRAHSGLFCRYKLVGGCGVGGGGRASGMRKEGGDGWEGEGERGKGGAGWNGG